MTNELDMRVDRLAFEAAQLVEGIDEYIGINFNRAKYTYDITAVIYGQEHTLRNALPLDVAECSDQVVMEYVTDAYQLIVDEAIFG